MFLLRCAFWLSIMYASLSWGAGALRSPHAFETAVAAQASGWTAPSAVVARAKDWCAERPAECLRDASRLTSLVQTASAARDTDGDEIVSPDAEAAVPLPVRDPRRHAARAVLTSTR